MLIDSTMTMRTAHPPQNRASIMVSLTDDQLAIVTDAARSLPTDKRSIYLERVGAMLAMRICGRDRVVTDADVSDVARLAMAGLIHQTADVA
jgi:hypothetical protein